MLSILPAESQVWHVAVHSTQHVEDDDAGCGSHHHPCYKLSSVMSRASDGDTVVLMRDAQKVSGEGCGHMNLLKLSAQSRNYGKLQKGIF